MGGTLIKYCVKWVLPGVLLCALLAGGAWWLRHNGYQSGFAAAKNLGDTALAREQKAHADTRQRLSEATTAALLKARQDEQAQLSRADALAATLADKTGELAQVRLLLGTQINKAVSDDSQTADSCGYNGLGPHSLQLYEKALGYGDGHARAGQRAEREAAARDGVGRHHAPRALSICGQSVRPAPGGAVASCGRLWRMVSGERGETEGAGGVFLAAERRQLMSFEFGEGLQALFFTLVASGLSIWLRGLNAAINQLRDEQVRMRETFQLKADAMRDQEQIMTMLGDIKQSMERTTERIDRLISGQGGR